MKTSSSLTIILLAALGALPCAGAATTWDNSSGTNAWFTAANWDTNIEPLAADDVLFPLGLGATITLISGELAKSLSFLDNYTFTGGGLTLASASSITVGSGLSVTSSTPITAPGGLTKLGDGMMIFSVANTFAGGVLVNAGTVRANHTGALGAAGIVTINTGGILEIGSISLDRPITLNSGAMLRGVAAATVSNGVHTISNAGSTALTFSTLTSTDVLTIGNASNDLTGGAADTVITVNGPGAVRLPVASNYAGLWQLDAGTLQLAAAGALGANTGSTVLNGGAISARSNTATTFSGPAALNVTADSSLVSDRSSTGAGVTHTFGALGIAGQILTITPGPLATSGTAGITVGNATITGNPAFNVVDVGSTNGKLTTGSIIGGGVARAITKTGAGDLSITGGATDWIAGSQLNASGGGTVEALYPTLGAGASITPTVLQSPFGEAALSVTNGGLRLAMDGENNSTAQTFVTGLAPSLAGTLTLEVDRRTIGSAKTVSLGSLSLASGTVLSLSASNSYKTTITGTTTLAGNTTIQGTSGKTTTLTLGAIAESATSTLTFGGASSTHTVNLTAAGGHTGGTNVKGDTINANVNGALSSGALLIENENVSSAAKLVVASGVTLSGPSSLAMNSGTLELQSLSAISGIPMQINGGNLSLRSNTAATFTTNGTGIVLDGGAPTITVGNVSSGSSLALNIGPLTLRNAPVITFANANSYSLTMGPLLLESDVTFNVNANVTARTSLDPNNLVAGVRESGGARKIIKSGTGTLELVGDSTTTGGLDVNAGTVLVKNNTGAGSGTITVGNGVTTGTVLLTTGISLNNAITVNGGALGRDSSGDGDVTFNGAITLAGDLEVQGNTTIPLPLREALFAGPITGAFDVRVANGGIVKLQSASNSFGSGAADSIIIDAAMLAVSSDAAMGNAANGITFSGSGPDFRPDSSISTARTFTLAHTGTADLQVNTGNDLTLTSSILGTGAISKSGAGALILGPLSDGSTRGSSLTTITSGTLRTQHVTGVSATGGIALGTDARFEMMVDADTSFAHAMTRTVTGGTAVLFVDRSPSGATTNGRHTLPSITYASDLGDFTVQGDHGYGLTVTSLSSFGGSLVNNAPGELRIGSLVSTNTNAQTLDLGGSGDMLILGATTQGTGSSSLRKVGAGTLTLGTSHGWTGALQCYEGLLNLNGLNVTASSIGMGLGSAQSTSTINTGAGSITLTGNVTYDESGTGVTEQAQSTINGPLNLGAATRSFTLDDSTQAAIDMEVNGVISGNAGVGLTKAGVGLLRLSGAGNTYDGLTTVSAGTLELNKSSGFAIGSGGLSILNTNTATAKLVQAAQFASSTPIIVGNGTAEASLELNNFTTTFDNLTLGGTQAALRVGATGTMMLGGNLTFENGSSTADRNMIITSTGSKGTLATGGTLDLGGAVRTITVNNAAAPTNTNPTATIETEIINGGIIKTGTSGLVLAHTANTFTSGLVIAQGTVIGAASGSFGTLPLSLTSGFGNTAVLGISISGANVTQDISTSGSGTNVLRYGGAIDTTATFSGAITLGSDLTFDVTNGEVDENDTALMIVSGVVNDGAGSFGIAKTGFGTTRLTQANTFDGSVTVSSGRLAFSDINALGTNTTITLNGGVLEAEADVTTSRNLVFTNDSTLRASTSDVGFEINGGVTTNNNDMGFIGAGQIILSSGGGGTGAMMIGTYSNAFGTVTTNKLTGNRGVLSTRSGFTIPSGNILMDNYWVWELTDDMTRALGTGAGEIQFPTRDGAGFAAFGADRTVNIGGAAATLIWGSGLFLVNGTNEGSLMFGCPSATHTVNWMNPLSMDNAETTPYLSFEVDDGPAAVEAAMQGTITFTGAGQGGLVFYGDGAMNLNGAVSGNLDLYANGTNTIRLTGGCTISGEVSVEGGLLEITTATSFGGREYVYVALGAELDIAATGVTLATTDTGYMEVLGTLTGSASAPGEFYGTGTITGDFTTAATTLYYGDPSLPLTVNGNINLAAGATLDWFFDETTVPGAYVAINAGGTVTLGSTLTLNVFAPLVIAPGGSFTLINKTSPGAVSGTFAGLAEGATFLAASGETFTISYIGGDGNDVVLTAPVTKAVATIGSYSLTAGVGAELGQIVFDMTATGTLSASYDLEASTDLVNWTVVQTVTADSLTGALAFHIAQSPVTFTQRFFRIH
jgi:fibronectin-binding autotransporter adhesin